MNDKGRYLQRPRRVVLEVPKPADRFSAGSTSVQAIGAEKRLIGMGIGLGKRRSNRSTRTRAQTGDSILYHSLLRLASREGFSGQSFEMPVPPEAVANSLSGKGCYRQEW